MWERWRRLFRVTFLTSNLLQSQGEKLFAHFGLNSFILQAVLASTHVADNIVAAESRLVDAKAIAKQKAKGRVFEATILSLEFAPIW